MSETPEHSTEPTTTSEGSSATPREVGAVTSAPPPARTEHVEPAPRRFDKPNRLYRLAALVVIVAGVVFLVAVIFFTGFVLGRHAGGGEGHEGGGHHRQEMGMFHKMGPPMGPRPEFLYPGGPGNFGGPGQSTQPATPASPSAPSRP
jgi:hypothetical protein